MFKGQELWVVQKRAFYYRHQSCIAYMSNPRILRVDSYEPIIGKLSEQPVGSRGIGHVAEMVEDQPPWGTDHEVSRFEQQLDRPVSG